jgi:hypothetical protein
MSALPDVLDKVPSSPALKKLSIGTPSETYLPYHSSHRRTPSSAALTSINVGRFGPAKKGVAFALLLVLGWFWVDRGDRRRWTGVWEDAVPKPGRGGKVGGGLKVENGVVVLAEDGEGTAEAAGTKLVTPPVGAPNLDHSEVPQDEEDDPPTTFPPPSSSSGLLPASLTPSLYTSPPLEHPATLLAFSHLPPKAGWSCLDTWISRGELCSDFEGRFAPGAEEETKIDVMWTYVNGSEPRMKLWRKQAARLVENRKEGENAAGVLRHFRGTLPITGLS